jgi:hypothetical protein
VLVIVAGIPLFYRWRGKQNQAISNTALSQPAPE